MRPASSSMGVTFRAPSIQVDNGGRGTLQCWSETLYKVPV
jgi:hypothetical protein